MSSNYKRFREIGFKTNITSCGYRNVTQLIQPSMNAVKYYILTLQLRYKKPWRFNQAQTEQVLLTNTVFFLEYNHPNVPLFSRLGHNTLYFVNEDVSRSYAFFFKVNSKYSYNSVGVNYLTKLHSYTK